MLISFMYNKREMEIILFLEENGFAERNNVFSKEIKDNISILVKDLNAIKIDFRIIYFKSYGFISDIKFLFEFDKKLVLDLCEFSKKINKFDTGDFSERYIYVVENKDGVFHFFQNGTEKFKYINDELVFA